MIIVCYCWGSMLRWWLRSPLQQWSLHQDSSDYSLLVQYLMHIYYSRMHHSCIHYPNRKYQNLLSSHSSRSPLNLYSNQKNSSARLRSLNLSSMSQRIESHLNMHLASSISKDTQIHIHSDQMLTFFQCSRYFQEHIVPYYNKMLINHNHHS